MGNLVAKFKFREKYHKLLGVKDRLAMTLKNSKRGKYILINTYWDKLVYQIKLKALRLKDKTTLTLLSHILKIPDDVKDCVIRKYID